MVVKCYHSLHTLQVNYSTITIVEQMWRGIHSPKDYALTVIEAISNGLPDVINKGTEIVENIGNGIMSVVGELGSTGNDSLQKFLDGITVALPGLLQKGIEIISNLVQGILSNLPQIISAAGNIINTFLSFFLQNLPTILQAGAQLILSIVEGISSNLPQIIVSVVQVVGQFTQTIVDNLPSIYESGYEILMELIAGILNTISDLVAALPEVIQAISDTFDDFDWLSIGANIVNGIAAGITNGAKTVIEAAKGLAQSAYDSACEFLGIESPSKLFKEVGGYTAQGFAIGIEDDTDYAKLAALELSRSSYEVSMTMAKGLNNAAAGSSYSGGYTQNITVNSPTELTPSEIARQTRIATRDMVLAMGGI